MSNHNVAHEKVTWEITSFSKNVGNFDTFVDAMYYYRHLSLVKHKEAWLYKRTRIIAGIHAWDVGTIYSDIKLLINPKTGKEFELDIKCKGDDEK